MSISSAIVVLAAEVAKEAVARLSKRAQPKKVPKEEK
jgi:hypothetical protein